MPLMMLPIYDARCVSLGEYVSDIANLEALIAPEAEALGFALVRVKFIGSGEDYSLQVMAERPDTRQLGIADCAALSRRISEKFDALEEAGQDPVSEPYRLEVSSPGIDRPLTRLADFTDWAGYEARLKLSDPVDGRKTLIGQLNGLDGEDAAAAILIHDNKIGPQQTAFTNILTAKLVLTDALIAATAPLVINDGDDELEIDDTPEEESD
jgi:ribosome maturation factor RimP